MSAQNSYAFHTGNGVAGGLYDIGPYVVDSRTNEEDNSKLRFGHGIVDGTAPGKQVKLPTAESTNENFEGIVVNSHAHEQDFNGDVHLRKGETVGVLKEGRAYVRLAAEAVPTYGAPLYLIVDGDEAGCFSHEAGESTAVKVNGYFIGGRETNDVAAVYVKVDKIKAAEASGTAEKETLSLSIEENKLKLTGDKGTSAEVDLPISSADKDGLLSKTDRAKITELQD